MESDDEAVNFGDLDVPTTRQSSQHASGISLNTDHGNVDILGPDPWGPDHQSEHPGHRGPLSPIMPGSYPSPPRLLPLRENSSNGDVMVDAPEGS